MRRRCSLCIVIAILFCIALSSVLKAQDPGTPDTVRIGTASVNPYAKFAVPVYLYNDEDINSIVIPLIINSYSGQARFDSVSYTGSRLAGASVLDSRLVTRFATDTFTVDSVLLQFSLASGGALPAGDGKLCDIWLTANYGGPVTIDSLGQSPSGHLQLISTTAENFTPQFIAGDVTVACNYLIGDVRNEGKVNVSAYLGIWKSFYGCEPTPYPNVVASDVNCDRLVDMRDQVALRKFVFGFGSLCTCGSYNPALYGDPGNADTVWIQNDTMVLGITDTITVGLINDEPLSGAAFGLEWNGTARLLAIWCGNCVTSRMSSQQLKSYSCLTGNGINPDTSFMSTSLTALSSADMIQPGRGAIYKIPVTPLAVGEITFRLIPFPYFASASMLVTETGAAIIPAVVGKITVVSAICGDANHDAKVNIGDAVYLINYVFKSGPAPNPACSGNANGDGSVNVADAVYLINYVFKSGPAPVAGCCP